MVAPIVAAGVRVLASGIGRMMSASLARTALARRLVVTQVKWEWFGERVAKNIEIGMSTRIKIAAMLLRDRVVVNISRPVTKIKGARSGRIRVDPASRSKPGEFPKADTTRLMKDIFWEMRGKDEAIVGTTLDYGAILEVSRRLDRSFLRRTLIQEQGNIRRVLLHGPKLPGQE